MANLSPETLAAIARAVMDAMQSSGPQHSSSSGASNREGGESIKEVRRLALQTMQRNSRFESCELHFNWSVGLEFNLDELQHVTYQTLNSNDVEDGHEESNKERLQRVMKATIKKYPFANVEGLTKMLQIELHNRYARLNSPKRMRAKRVMDDDEEKGPSSKHQRPGEDSTSSNHSAAPSPATSSDSVEMHSSSGLRGASSQSLPFVDGYHTLNLAAAAGAR